MNNSNVINGEQGGRTHTGATATHLNFQVPGLCLFKPNHIQRQFSSSFPTLIVESTKLELKNILLNAIIHFVSKVVYVTPLRVHY